MLARVNSIAYLCSTETRNATAHAACDSNNPTGHRALPDYTETRERSGKSACLLHSYKSMYNLSNFGEYYIHPFILNAQMYLWSNGIRPWSFNPYLDLR